MNLHCTHSRTDLLGSKLSSSEVYILEFRAQAKVSCYHYSAKLQLLKWLGFQCHSHVLFQTEPQHHQEEGTLFHVEDSFVLGHIMYLSQFFVNVITLHRK